MFRRLMTLIAALALVGAGWSLPAQAVPISGSATLDIVFHPQNYIKIDKIDVKLEFDLVLTLSVSGIDITSISIFTFRGLEFQSFVFVGTIGALAIRDQFIFAPNIIEIEEVRDLLGLPTYCVNYADPAIRDDDGVPLAIGLPDCNIEDDYNAEHYLYMLIEGSSLYAASWFGLWPYILPGGMYLHPALRNLYLARIMEDQDTDPLGQALTFRKKTVELTISIAGLTIGLRGMFANVGTAATPSWRTGLIASAEGSTVSGIFIRGETWIGAKQGVECFGECKPLAIIRGGKIIDAPLTVYEEKLFIRNLKLAGITFGARLEFGFADPPVGLQFMQLTQAFTLAPFKLDIINTINIGNIGPNDLTILSDEIVTYLKIGDMSATAIFYIWPNDTGAFNIFWGRLITTFDPPGMKFTSDIQMCHDENQCLIGTGLFYHMIYLSTTVGDVSIDISVSFGALLTAFRQAIVDVGWKLGTVTIKSSTIVNENNLEAQMFSIGVTF